MRFEPGQLREVWRILPQRHEDERGFFSRTWCVDEFRDHGLNPCVRQCNVSYNRRRGTLRGMHLQSSPHQEAKLVRCTMGKIFDVAVDLRPDSETYLQWESFELSAANREAVYIPEGVAHGFQSLQDDTEVFYQMSESYHADAAVGYHWNDPAFGIQWPLKVTAISERDAGHPTWAERHGNQEVEAEHAASGIGLAVADLPIEEDRKTSLHIGVVCSTDGGAFRAIRHAVSSLPSLKCHWYVATDRECGIERFCTQHQISWRRFPSRTNDEFSRLAAEWFAGFGTLDGVQLFYSRLVTESLYRRFPTVNFHPSLLPAFPGMNSVRKAKRHGARFIGATAHLVDSGMDTGPIIAQACAPLDAACTEAQLDRMSYLQKVQLALVIIDLMSKGQLLFSRDNRHFALAEHLPGSASCNPMLTCPHLAAAYQDLTTAENSGVAA